MSSCFGQKCSSSRKATPVTPKFNGTSTTLDVITQLNTNLDGKVVLITGATSGLGIETARTLAKVNAHVFITARDTQKGAQIVEDIKKSTGNNKVEVMEMDLTSLASVRNFANKFRQRNLPINILICNAGIMACPYSKTIDGFESQFGVNHLAHFHLVNLLLPELKAGKPSRVIVVSSVANKMGPVNFDDVNFERHYDKWAAYAQSKSANILFAKQFNKLYEKHGVQAFSLHPGVISTGLQKHMATEELQALGMFKPDGTLSEFCKTIEQGAATSVYAAVAPELINHGGQYLEDCGISRGLNTGSEYWGMAAHVLDMNNAERLWKLSEKLIGSK